MNGDWDPYSGTPSAFIALWIRVYKAINAAAPTVAMVRAPSMDFEDSKYPYAPYWPGPEYVDWVIQGGE
ncbi:hypothetical protein HDU98_003880, partial [Podochytrium sp. JEL0797]